MRSRGFWIVALPVLLLVSAVRPSWAWRGGWGWRGGGGWGWGGPRLGIYLGGPYWDDPYPYYDPYYYQPAPYAYPPYAGYPASSVDQVSPSSDEALEPDNSRHDLKVVRAQIARQLEQINYDYSDGDISKAERDERLDRLNELSKQAREEAKANGGFLTGEEQEALLAQLQGRSPRSFARSAPSSAPSERTAQPALRRDLTAVTDLHLELRTLLDQKLKEGNITQAQQAAEAKYLDQLDQQAHAAAAANGGTLTADQESAFVQQLHRAYYAINHNLISHE